MTITRDRVAELRAEARAAEIELFEQSVGEALAAFVERVMEKPTERHPPRYACNDEQWDDALPTHGPSEGDEYETGAWTVKGTGSSIQALVGAPNGRAVEVARLNMGNIHAAANGETGR